MEYEIKNTHTRKVSITVYPDGRVVVTKPRRIPLFLAKAFVNRKMGWIQKKLAIQKNKKPLLVNPDVTKAEALKIVMERISHFNEHYQFGFNKVTIKNLRFLWGSCSAKKNLNFNHKIVHLPQHQMDYIIVHELCHLKELNHSKQFWTLVGETIPNHKVIRKELRQYSFQ